VSLFVGHGLSRGRGKKSHLKFYIKEVVLRIYRRCEGCWDFVDDSPTLRPLESVPLLELSNEFREAYNAGIL
jgi:hypothetical protein